MSPRILFLFLLIVTTGCGLIIMDYVPSVQIIQSRLPEFIQETITIEGLYGNRDVDSLIFRFSIPSGKAFSTESTMLKIEQTALSKRWKVIEKKPMYQGQYAIYTTLYSIRFGRFGQRGRFYSSEEVRVVAIPEQAKLSRVNPKIYVAWIQTDSTSKVDRIEDNVEWRWAVKEFWPKFESYILTELEQVTPIKTQK